MYGTEPKIESRKGRQVLTCETCHREMKYLVPGEGDPQSLQITNRCQEHKNGDKLEPCYYCHLMQNHLNLEKSEEP